MAEPLQTHVISPLGVLGSVPASEIERAIAEGYREATPDEVTREQKREAYGGPGHTALATIAGAARGATLGLSDVALSSLGAGEALRAYREVSPYASVAGELGGTLGAAAVETLATGGAGAPAAAGAIGRLGRIATLPVRGAMRAGAAVVTMVLMLRIQRQLGRD